MPILALQIYKYYYKTTLFDISQTLLFVTYFKFASNKPLSETNKKHAN